MSNITTFFDTHAHLTDEAFSADLDVVVKRSIESNVANIVTIGMDETSSRLAREIAHRFGIWFTAGIHPAESALVNDQTARYIEELSFDDRCVAIGEIGLDNYWKEPPAEHQLKVFRQMLEVASRTKLPVVLHQRESFKQLIEVIDEYELPGRGIFHCFGGSVEQAEEIISRGFYLSFAGNVAYKKGGLEDVIRNIPKERILIETDSPYLTPVPMRGKRNEPANVKFTATKISEILELELEEIMKLTCENAYSAFKILK